MQFKTPRCSTFLHMRAFLFHFFLLFFFLWQKMVHQQHFLFFSSLLLFPFLFCSFFLYLTLSFSIIKPKSSTNKTRLKWAISAMLGNDDAQRLICPSSPLNVISSSSFVSTGHAKTTRHICFQIHESQLFNAIEGSPLQYF